MIEKPECYFLCRTGMAFSKEWTASGGNDKGVDLLPFRNSG